MPTWVAGHLNTEYLNHAISKAVALWRNLTIKLALTFSAVVGCQKAQTGAL